jgi:senataxin
MQTDLISPPGTGKTSTICGLIDAFLASRAAPAVPINVGANAVKPPVLKALICAPSNAAIDEVALRVKEGSRYAKRNYTPKVVRIGADNAISSTVQDISLEFLVDQKMGLEGFSNSSNVSNEINLLRDQINEIKKERQTKQEELSRSTGNPAKHLSLEGDIRQLNARRQDLIQRMDRLRDQQKSEFRSQDAARRKFRRVVLDEADVICSTLSSAGRENIEDYEFDMLVIDEAAQAIELSALIPLKYKCKRCVMVGGEYFA